MSSETIKIKELESMVNFLFKRIDLVEKSLKVTDKTLADTLNLLDGKKTNKAEG